jgi:uncharacterized small protein (DUF1192 family)
MTIDDDLPRPKPLLFSPRDLAPLGIEELQTYIASLQTEIARADGEIMRKKQQRDAASLFFKRHDAAR